MPSGHHQKGLSAFGLLVVLFILGVVFTIGIKLFTPYWEHKTVEEVLENVVSDPQELSKPVREIRSDIHKRLSINQIRIPDERESIDVVDDRGTIRINVDYEVRVKMFLNIDAVLSFKNHYEGTRP